jgi:hypothetical protein
LFHQYFGDFKVYFEPDPDDQRPHTYRIASFLPAPFLRDRPLPITRLPHRQQPHHRPPSHRLLAIHCAIAHILHLSAAGEYIDRILRDAEDDQMLLISDPSPIPGSK